MVETKASVALRIIAGIQPPWAHWKLFFPGEDQPKFKTRDANSFAQHRDDINLRVRAAACEYIAERLNAQEGDLLNLCGHDESKPLYGGMDRDHPQEN